MTNDARVQTLTISLARSDAGAHLVNSSPRVTHYHIRINESTEADLFVLEPKVRNLGPLKRDFF